MLEAFTDYFNRGSASPRPACNGVVMGRASARSARSKGAAGAVGWRRNEPAG
jgi:hypothetical protein